ncbi:translation protein SH3-like domain-containing protein [Kockovaella imperatae]|uniref:Translation protein SH3-like domain-containing protein n=1 Tax=Kockovaella imperatae TaxID=4999 RepID=A0A1Y1U6M6_9TREE|nr:translation protein SH3-like domain-containing protein [Kockovaella imperatae]ORX33668.1 translation protein SH3-like domain-containing protein [Kockovaella imperatae]
MSRSLRTLSSAALPARCIAGPSRLPLDTIRKASTQAASNPSSPSSSPSSSPAALASASVQSTASYPYSSSIVSKPSTLETPTPRRNLLHPKKGWSVIEHLNSHLRSQYDTLSLSTTLFARKSPERLRTGSIITVTSWTNAAKTATTSFSGVLIGTKHRGIDTSFRVRNVVSRIGVEYNFKCCSPLLKEVKVIKSAKGKKGPGRDLGTRKAYWVRDRPDILSKIAAQASKAVKSR